MNTCYRNRLSRLRDELIAHHIDAALITPGSHLTYFTGITGHAVERLMGLLLIATPPNENSNNTLNGFFITPEIELENYTSSPIATEIPAISWRDGQDPLHIIIQALGTHNATIAVSEDTQARHSVPLADLLDNPLSLASPMINAIRIYKDETEIAALLEAGAAADRVHLAVPQYLRVGRTEAEVAADITHEMLAQGHKKVGFVIVGSGPNSALPHHRHSDRVITAGDIVVIDIGGSMPSGYYSDTTRVYSMGKPARDIAEKISLLQQAQSLAMSRIAPGVKVEEIDYAARNFLREHQLDEYFSHRLGHGIGLSVHEAPDIIAGNTLALAPGCAFSVEPGIYFPHQWGARIEDIVIVTEDGHISCNNSPHELIVID